MSLINQMLRDLEDRLPPREGGLPAGLTPVPCRRVRPWPWLLASALGLGLAGTLWWLGPSAPVLAVLSTPPAAGPGPLPTLLPPLPDPPPELVAVAPPVPPVVKAQPVPVKPDGPALRLDFQPLTGSLSFSPSVGTSSAVPGPPSPTLPRQGGGDAGATPGRKPATSNGRTTVKQPSTPDPVHGAEGAYRRALTQAQAGDRPGARRTLAEALKAAPNHHRAREALAALWLADGDQAQARRLLADGLALAPTHPPFARLQGRLLVEAGQPDQAVGVLEGALAGADDDHLALLAALYQGQGRHRESARLYLTALGRQPRQGPWWAGLGIALEGSGDPAAARDAYHRARTLALDASLERYVSDRLAALDP